MPHDPFRPLVLLAVLAIATPSVPAMVGVAVKAGEPLPFPLIVRSDEGLQGLTLAPSAALLERVAGLSAVQFPEVALPGGRSVGLELQRVQVAAAGAVLSVDGVLRPGVALDAGVSLWTGTVAGDPQSDVYLAFSLSGSRGWIRTGGDLLHLLAQPDDAGNWSAGSGRLVSEGTLTAQRGAAIEPCQAMSIPQPFADALPKPAAATPADGSPLPLLECQVALETDYQYFQLFNDLDAAQTYAMSLFGAVSSRYREQVGVVITLPYLGLYTTSADPWSSQDSGGGSFDVLYEFQEAWAPGFGGAPPISAAIYHFISGASLGGGVAYLDVLCNEDYAFGVSGNLGGVTPIPIVPADTLNWDFVVISHELGHNFNAIHTHDYCPPADECAPDGYFGGCQTAQNCTTQGTIMSYCHLCDGGFLNETTFFHPLSVADMRAAAEVSCMQPFEGVFATDLGYAKTGTNGLPALGIDYDAVTNILTFDVNNAPTLKQGTLFISLNLALLPFKGGTLVPAPDLLIAVISNVVGSVSLPLAVTLSFPSGITLYTQAWFKNVGSTAAATNAVQMELHIP